MVPEKQEARPTIETTLTSLHAHFRAGDKLNVPGLLHTVYQIQELGYGDDEAIDHLLTLFGKARRNQVGAGITQVLDQAHKAGDIPQLRRNIKALEMLKLHTQPNVVNLITILNRVHHLEEPILVEPASASASAPVTESEPENQVITTPKGNPLSERVQRVVVSCRREQTRVEGELKRLSTAVEQKYQQQLDSLDKNSPEYQELLQRAVREVLTQNPTLSEVEWKLTSVERGILRLTDNIAELPNLNALIYEQTEIQNNRIQNLDQVIRLHELSRLISNYPWQSHFIERARMEVEETISWLQEQAPECNLNFNQEVWPEIPRLSREDEIRAGRLLSRTVFADSPLLPALEQLGQRVGMDSSTRDSDFDSEDLALGRRYNSVGEDLDGIWEQLSEEITAEKRVALESKLGKALGEVIAIDRDYRKKYQWGDLLVLEDLGSHATSFARRAIVSGGIAGLRGETREPHDIQVAIKVAKSKNWYEGVRGEAGNLEALRKKQAELFPSSPSHFPDSVLINSPDGRPVLAMEFISASGIGSLEIDHSQWLDVLTQACETIAVAHAIRIYNSDRAKSYDEMRYFPQTGRFVMLDWTGMPNPSNGGELLGVIDIFRGADDYLKKQNKPGIFSTDIRDRVDTIMDCLSRVLHERKKIDASTSMKVAKLVKDINLVSAQDIKAVINS